MRRTVLLSTVAQLALTTAAFGQPALNAQPTGGSVTAGSATIAQTATATTITQSSQRAAIDWQSFDIGSQQTVQFRQPSVAASTLNRVIGPNPSQIAGQLQANGQVVIVNQSGVVFYKGAQVNTAGLMVSAAGISDDNFMAGRMVFDQPANPEALVANQGTITIRQAGLAALVAPQVANSGVIKARLGHVVLAGAQTATLDLYGDGLLAIDVTGQVVQAPDGSTALVTNTGIIRADGGTVQLTARAADGVVQQLVDAGGSIRADTAHGRLGTVVLSGIGGSITVTGQLTADGTTPGSTGGRIAVNATGTVAIADGARISASGPAGGGVIAIGTTLARAAGGPGTVSRRTAAHVAIASGATIAANATQQGNGGRVAVLSGQATEMDGVIEATGGPLGGDGGFVETSGPVLNVGNSATVDASARNPRGQSGTWLLDPLDLDVVSGSGTANVDESDGPPFTFTPNNSGAQVGNLVIERELNAGTNVKLTTEGTSGGAAGDITVDAGASITWSTNATLTMTASGGISLDASIANANGGTLVMSAGGAITQDAASGAITVPNLEITAGGPVNLTAANSVGTLAGSVTGAGQGFAFRDDNTSLTIGSVGGVAGITTAGGGIALSTTGSGAITLDAPIASSGGEIDIAAAPGAGIANYSTIASGGGNVVLLGDSIILASEANGTIVAGNGVVVLGPSTQTDNIEIGEPSGDGWLGLQSTDLATISAGMVQIGYRAEDGSPAFTGTIAIAGSSAFNVNAANIPALLLVTGGATGAVTQTEPLSFNGGTLGVIADGTVKLPDTGNGVSTVAVYTASNGPLAMASAGDLTIGTLPLAQRGVNVDAATGLASSAPMASNPGGPTNPLSGIVTAGSLTVGTQGSLTLAANVTAPGQTVTLGADVSITQTGGVITAGTLTGGAPGAISLTGANAITTLSDLGTEAGLTLNNAQDLTVTGAVVALGGLTINDSGVLTISGSLSNGPNINVTASSIAITLTGLISDGGSGTTSLTATSGTINDQGLLLVGTLTGSSAGAATLTGASFLNTRITTLGSFSAPNLTLTDGTSLVITGPVDADYLTISAPGQITLAGNIATIGAPLSQQSGESPAPGGSTLQVLASITPGSGATSFVQTGTVALSDPPSTTLRIQLPASGGSASFANLVGTGANLVLAVGSGTATGTVQVGGLLVIGQGGSVTLNGSIAGSTTQAAAASGQITPAVNASYTFNGCTIGLTSCRGSGGGGFVSSGNSTAVLGALSWFLPGAFLLPPAPLQSLNLVVLPMPPLTAGQLAPQDVVPPNISFQDY